LTSDLGHVANRVFNDFFIGNRLTEAHVQCDFGQTRNLHARLVAKFCGQRRNDFFFVGLL